ncbi:hypothetical protein AFK68_10615, partial [Hydrocoleum sp. CS-953]|uniref:hypothetical protein n=1 Tax=Hydrocoleum sp. CS-953 TaxID=1671698 RepID=UPI000BD3CB59
GNFATWATRSGVEVLTGDFNGDNRTDVALLRQDPGWSTMPVAFSDTDGSFTVTNESIGNFATWATRSGVEILA